MCRYPPGLIRNRGMTAVELLFTMAIAALVLALAVPNFRDFVQNNRAAEEANALVGALALARSEAVTRGIPVTVCSSTDSETCAEVNDWSTGWIVFTDIDALAEVNDDDVVIRALPELRNGSELTADASFVTYTANGFLGALPGEDPAVVTFDLDIPDCTGNHNRTISVNLQGRGSVANAACD